MNETDIQLEKRLRDFYRRDGSDAVTAPIELRTVVLTILRTVPRELPRQRAAD